MDHMRIQINLLTKHIVSEYEKVNVVGQKYRYQDKDIDLQEKANYLGNQGGFKNYNFRKQGYNTRNVDQNYSRDGQYERKENEDQQNWRNIEGYKNDHSGVYVTPSSRGQATKISSGSKMEDMMA